MSSSRERRLGSCRVRGHRIQELPPFLTYRNVVPMKIAPENRIRRRFMVMVATAAVLSSLAIASPSQAVDGAARGSVPIKAGTSLAMMGTNVGPFHSPDGVCTAGPVMYYARFLYRIRPYDRAVRYVLTAKHCASLNQMVRVGGVEVGKVTWLSPDTDIALVRIEPSYTRSRSCYSTSAGPRCSILETYTPRAVGQVILAQNRSGQETSIPVTGSGAPSPGEKFCTSGQTTGIICDFTSLRKPPSMHLDTNELPALTSSINPAAGDSGAPVVSAGGTIYGIHTGNYQDVAGKFPEFMGYVPIDVALRQLSGYALVRG